MIPVHVHGVGMSPYNQGFVALLMDESSQEWLPIYIGSFEAQAIAMELDEVNAPRPMTHDLIASVIGDLQINVEKVVITDLRDGTFFANIILKPEDSEKEIVIDARPSDSIAVALRLDADIYVEEEVMEEAAIPAQVEEEETEQQKKLKILQQRLQRAVEEEEFEEAAELRDEIKELKEEIHNIPEHPENKDPDADQDFT